jgi:hypothetical protein
LWSYEWMSVFTEKSRLRAAYPKIFCGKDKTPHLSVDTTCCVLRSKFDGWSLIPEGCHVVIDTFGPEGTSSRLA